MTNWRNSEKDIKPHLHQQALVCNWYTTAHKVRIRWDTIAAYSTEQF